MGAYPVYLQSCVFLLRRAYIGYMVHGVCVCVCVCVRVCVCARARVDCSINCMEKVLSLAADVQGVMISNPLSFRK